MRSRMSLPATIAALSLGLSACSERASLPTQARSVPVTALAAAGGGTNTAVTATIADADPAVAPTLQLKSDGGGAYKNSTSLISVIQGNGFGDWELDSFNPKNSTRTVDLEFSRPIAGSGPNGGDPIAIPSGKYKVHMISKCHLYGNSFFTIAPGQTVACPLHIGGVYVGTQEYSVQMNPSLSSADTAWTETNYANVSCTSTAGSCSSWTLTPSGTDPDGSRANVAALLAYQRTTVRGKTTTTIVKQGDFWMSFRIGVTAP